MRLRATRRREPVFRRRDWAFPAPPVDREIVEVLPENGSGPRRPPLLFVHGAWHGSWCWQEHWMPAAVAAGWACYAVDLRGHGASGGRDRLGRTPLRFFEHDVLQAITEMPSPPVLVGHSMGGLIVQRVLERYRSAPAGVLVGALPPDHGLGIVGRMLRHDPLGLAHAAAGRPPQLRHRTHFGSATDAHRAARHTARLDEESVLATYQLILPRRVPDVRCPVLVLGGGDDRIVPPADIARTARLYGTRAHLFRGLGHDLMLEDDWKAPLDTMLAWLDETVPR